MDCKSVPKNALVYEIESWNKAGRVWGCGFSPKVIWGVVKDKAKNL
jgi:hypothetical protein